MPRVRHTTYRHVNDVVPHNAATSGRRVREAEPTDMRPTTDIYTTDIVQCHSQTYNIMPHVRHTTYKHVTDVVSHNTATSGRRVREAEPRHTCADVVPHNTATSSRGVRGAEPTGT